MHPTSDLFVTPAISPSNTFVEGENLIKINRV